MFEGLSKKQKVSLFLILAVVSGIIGWIYEVIFYYFNGGMTDIYLRGSNFLPFINIYAYGSILLVILTHDRLKHPVKVFLICVIATGILEYLSGLVLYDWIGYERQWDYNQEILNFGNIKGFVCLRSVLIFGVFGLFLMYVLLPFLIKIVKSKYSDIIFIVSIIIFSIVLIDEIYNFFGYIILKLPSAVDIYKGLGFKYMKF